MARDEGVVVELGIGAINAIDFGSLAGAQGFARIEAPDSFKQSLAAQDLMQAGDAAGETVSGVEEGGVGVGDGDGPGEEVAADIHGLLALGEQLDGASRPDGPVAEESTHDSALNHFAIDFKSKWG